VDHVPEKSWLKFGSDPENIPDVLIFIVFIDSPEVDLCEKLKSGSENQLWSSAEIN